jgi:ribonuclease HI/transposase InsO family protein
MMLTEG